MRLRSSGRLGAALLALLPVLALPACNQEAPDLSVPPASQATARIPFEDDAPGFGGFSALEVLEDGRRFVALSDGGLLVQGDLQRDARGQLTGVRVTSRHWLVHPEGHRVRQKGQDPEGLALLPDGRLIVSFEHYTPPWIYEGAIGHPDGTRLPAPEALENPPDSPILGANTAYETAAVDAQGRLILIPERPAGGGPLHPIWRLGEDGWTRVADWPRDAGFLPVGADLGPDGQLYVLERAFGLGFSGRIRRIDLAQPDRAPQLVALLPRDRRSNYEGLSAWADDNGTLRLTMISDNNFTGLLNQQILEISLAGSPDSG